MCQSLNWHISFPWWLVSLSTEATLTKFPSLHKACMIDWCRKKIQKSSFGPCNPQSLPLFPGPVFCPNILLTTARMIHNYQWRFSYILHELPISLMFPSKCSCFGENFKSMQISPTTLITSCKMSHYLVIDFTDRLRECPWHCMTTAFDYSAKIWVETPDFLPIMFDIPLWPLQLLKLRFILMRMSLVT